VKVTGERFEDFFTSPGRWTLMEERAVRFRNRMSDQVSQHRAWEYRNARWTPLSATARKGVRDGSLVHTVVWNLAVGFAAWYLCS